MNGVGGFFALVLAQLVAGGLVITWCSPLWSEAKRSYFTIYSAILLVVFALPAWLVVRGSAGSSGEAVWAERLALVTMVLVASTTALMMARRQAVARLLGLASASVSVGVIVALAGLADRDLPLAVLQISAGALFLGSAYDLLFLGHWYLTDRKLTRAPIQRYVNLLIGACVVELIAIGAAGFSGGVVSPSLNPLLAIGDVAPWIAIGMTVATLLITVLAKAALRGQRASAVRSATGFSYLAVITAIVGEIAVKTRFFPG
ncbi:MAG: hypothetical protein WD096_00825 [Actinomycetota bacterium]